MHRNQGPFFKFVKYAIIVAISISFVAATVPVSKAASVSFIDSVIGYFGLTVDHDSGEQQNAAYAGEALVSTTVVISQFNGGGGGSTGTYLNDYVELKNISSSPQSLNGLSLYYGSATGNFASTATNAFALPDVTLNPGQYYLVQLGSVGTAGLPLPVTPDATTTNLNMSATNGKVALVTAALAINTCGAAATPCDATQLSFIVDWAAYGTGGNGTAGNGEGGTSVNNGAAMVSTQGGVRKVGGCQDSDNNNNDFDVVTAPVPRNTATAPASCSGGPTPTATSTFAGSPTPTNTFTPTNTATATATHTPTGAPSASPTPPQGGTLVISQFDGGGGGSTGTYLNDYVEIKNVSSSAQSLNGLSLYYGSATGNFASTATNAFALPDVSLNPGQYYLVQLGSVGTAGLPLPVTPDATTTNLNMSGTNGKVALVTAGLAINTCGAAATPCDATQLSFIVDWAAYGTGGNGTAGNGEGGTSVNNGVAMVSTQGGVRKVNGCQDTNNNNNDFDVVTDPVPRNTATAAAPCTGGPTPTASFTATGSPSPTNTATATSTPTHTATGVPTPPQGATLVISQFNGGGGGSTGTYVHDYVEIKNISGVSQSLNGLSLYYGSAAGNFASTASNAFALPDVSISPGQYYLVQLGPAGTAGNPFPVTPDATTGNLTMSGTNGKVALVTAALPINTCGATATPCDATQLSFIVDWAAYGTGGNGTPGNGEGGTSVNNGVSMVATQGGVRKAGGCQDTNNNNNDFDVVTAPVPRNTATAAAPCVTGTPTNTPTGSPTPTNTATSTPTPLPANTLVISQFNGGGGGSIGTYQNDYVEIKNISSTTQSLNGLSLYYGAAAGNFASTTVNAFALPNVTLSPGQFYLVQLGDTGTGGAQLPTPDATTTNLNMSGTTGKIALVTASLAINACGSTTDACTPTELSFIVDWAAYGTGGNGTPGNGEGGTSVNNGVLMTATQGGVRKGGGCQDTNNNNNDFDVVTNPVPRNSATVVPCAGSPTPTATLTFTPTATATVAVSPTPTATNTPTGSPTSTPACATTTNLSGSQEVPSNGSTGTGIGTVRLNADQTSITVDLSWSGLSSNAIAAHIHGPAPAGTNAGIVFGLSGIPASPTGAIATQTFAVTPAQVAQFRAGLFYLNVHTTNFAGGEIRGQLLPKCSVRADFDGDGRSDISVFRPSEGNWYLNRSTAGETGVNFGLSGDTPIPGDYDGDGKTDIAVFRGDSTDANPDFFILNSATSTVTYEFWGLQTDQPLSGDHDGDGKTDITVYRPSSGSWYIKESGGGFQALAFGAPGDVPMYMDYNGDGRSNLAVFRPSTGTWYIARQTGVPAQNFDAIQFGIATDMPVPADFDGDHKDDIAVFRPSEGFWYGLLSTEGFAAVNFGLSGDIPVPGDYDGDSQADVAVYRNGTWYFDLSGSGFSAVNYGLPTDIPIPKKYIP